MFIQSVSEDTDGLALRPVVYQCSVQYSLVSQTSSLSSNVLHIVQ